MKLGSVIIIIAEFNNHFSSVLVEMANHFILAFVSRFNLHLDGSSFNCRTQTGMLVTLYKSYNTKQYGTQKLFCVTLGMSVQMFSKVVTYYKQ